MITFSLRSVRSCLGLVLFSVGLTSSGWAQSFLTRWTFDGANDAADMSVTIGFGSSVGAVATASKAFNSISVGTGAAEGWAPAIGSYAPGDYFEFTVNLNVPNAYVVNTISLSSSSFLNGASSWAVRSELDAYSAVLGTGLTNGNSPTSLSTLGLNIGGGDAFTFRVYGVGGNAATFNGFGVDNVTVSGSLVAASAVPEPSAFAALCGISVLGLTLTRRRRRG